LTQNPENTIKSPIWLKDKGDEFLQNGDYTSAIDAYNSALRLDQTYWPALANRSLCHLQLFNIDDCMADCNTLLAKSMELEKNEQMTPMVRIIREKIYLRTLTCYAVKGEFHHFEELADLLLSQPFLREPAKELVKRDLQTILARKSMLEKKEKVDEQLKASRYSDALKGYQALMDENQERSANERILSNISLCELKMDNFTECINYSTEVITLILKYLNKNLSQPDRSKQNEYYKNILIKSYYRRAQSYFKQEQVKECEADLREILLIDERNDEARAMKKTIEQGRSLQEALQAKTLGDSSLKEGSHAVALEHYSTALSKFDPAEKPIEYISVLLNMTVCHTALEQIDEVISDCIKGLRVISKHSKAVIKLEKTRLTKEELEKMKQIELRFYMRKGNAFLKKGQIYHAKADFEEAIKLAPDNQEIRQSLDKIAML
jgi:tetratricopeptide (TPR) repeat protein